MGDVGLELLLQRFELFNGGSVGSSTSTSTSTPGKDKGKGKDLGMGMEREVSSPITRSTTTRVNQNAQPEAQRNIIHKQSDIYPSRQSIAPSPLSNRTNITTTTSTNTTNNPKSNSKPVAQPPTQPRAHIGKPKPFKTPFLNPPTVRSSPRRTVPPSPLRALPIQTPTRAAVKGHNANVDIGEDEPEGNDSFDSFDGMFQEGGPEVEELFRAVDGSKA
jgi:hypothetical protein